MSKKAFSFHLEYANGAKSHHRKKYEKVLIIQEMINLLNDREVLDNLAESFILKHGNKIILKCPSKDLNEDKVDKISFPKKGLPLTYDESVRFRLTAEDKEFLRVLGGGSIAKAVRMLIEEKKNPS